MGGTLYTIKSQVKWFSKVVVLSKYEIRNSYQGHYLGKFWEILNPLIQILIYYFVFGIKLEGDKRIGDIPYLFWMIGGLIPWFFISSSIIQSANSVLNKGQLFIRTDFPMEAVPLIPIINNLRRFIIMTIIFVLTLLMNNITITIYIFYYFLYVFFLTLFLDSLGIFLSALVVVFRDVKQILTSIIRILFYISGVTIQIDSKNGSIFEKILSMNPLYYFIEGFRDIFFSRAIFFQNMDKTFFVLSLMLFIYILGAMLLNNIKNNYLEYL
ncbi:ABC transporter permease [Enterococcus faecalis]|uniref:ABC transporter permease n=1 Tax=Enterococcus faecalis TaxID=1351 RepID=UPI001386894B|nr:ABC transporter permease [Enterococcus faecalis]MEB7428033.1 ABC transporter permease [Enterococcus faecalis]